MLTIFVTTNNNAKMNNDDIEKIVLSTVRTMDSIRKVRDFMFADIEKCLDIIPAANFLLALGLCCYTEYWGKFLNMTEEDYKKQKPKPKIGYNTKCFNDFFGRLGPCYVELLKQVKVYHEVRCGMAHAYLIEKNAAIVIEGGTCGLSHSEDSSSYVYYVRRYYEDFRNAVNRYILGLESGSEDFKMAKNTLEHKPQLI
jgi:hypothetical protein